MKPSEFESFYPELTPTERSVAEAADHIMDYESLRGKAAEIDELENWFYDPDFEEEVRGEQPESPIHSDPGALRGDVPLSSPDKEIK